MFIDIDYDKRKKGYKINLAKPNQQTIASISEAYGTNYSIKLGNINEVTFNVPYFIDKLDERVKNENIELIKEKMYTKISYNNNDEWMIIDTIEDVGSGDEKYMTVTAFTNVYETSNRKINELNLEVVNPEEYYDAVLNDVAWSIGTIDPLFKDIYRSVELGNVTVLEAIITGAETFGAVLDFDTENKKINLIDIDSKAKYRGLNINYSNFLQSINRKRSVDEMTTRLYVYGSEDLSIENVNPTGMRYLEDFTYFLYPFERDENKNVIKSSHYMSDELAHAILDKNELSKEYEPRIQAMQEEIDEETIEYINETTLLNELRFDEMSVSGLLDIAKATGDNDLILQRQSELEEIKTKISIKELTVDHIDATIEDLERQISQLQSQISVTSFSKELYNELSMYIIESEFRDDRYIDEEELYRDAVKKFEESKSPNVVIEASIDNIIDSLEEDYYSDKVVLGDIARVTDKEMSVEMKSLITELSFDLDNNTCDVTIANGDIEKDGYDRILSVLYDTQSTTTMLENNKYKWDTVTDVKTEVDLMRDSEIDATRNRIKAGFRESVTIEDRGIILSNPDFPNEIVIMQAGVIALSTDGGENWSTSITPRGVMADTIVGKLVASNNLIVTNDSGSFRIDGDGLTVDMDSIKIMSGEGDTPENIVDSWNKMLITMDEFADDGKLNEYEKNQIARQWNSIAIAHSSMVDAIQDAYGPETPENPYPAEYEIYMESYEKLRRYLNDEIQSDGHTILDPLNRSETTDIDSDKYNRLVSDYEVNKDRFQTVIPLEFSQTFIEQTRQEISLNYVKNGEIATKLNLSEEGIRIDGRLLEINSETQFNDDLVMNAGLIRSKDNAINIDLNTGEINLARPLTINSVPVATEGYVEESLADAIKNIDVEYGITSDKDTAPTDWSTTPPAWQDGKYIWSRTLTVYKNGNTEITEPVNITGATGSSGGTGQDGRSVKSIQEQYYLSTSPVDLENGSWLDNPPEWEKDKYIWTRSVITYENPSGVYRTEPISVSGPQGPQGDQGIQGKDGRDSYTHIAYATGDQGQTFSHSTFEQATHIGMYVSNNQASSTNWRDYEWTLIKGKDGKQGLPGPEGLGGITPYFHTAYANSADGKVDFSVDDSTDKEYIGQYTSYARTGKGRNLVIPNEYVQFGNSGAIEIDGYSLTMVNAYTDSPVFYMIRHKDKGSTYTLSFKSDTEDVSQTRIYWYGAYPSSITQHRLRQFSEFSSGYTFTPGDDVEYIAVGLYAHTSVDSNDLPYTFYDWKLEKGSEATEYSIAPEDAMQDSTNPEDYRWTKIKGEQGPQGIEGPKGTDGQSQYVHMRYSANSNGSGFVPTPNSNTKYIGIAVTSSSTAPTGASSYTWSKFIGEDGSRGIQGPKGTDGKTTYTWVKYADDVDGNGISDSPSGKMFIGLAFNKETESESNNPNDYQWSAMYDEEAFKGIGLADKTEVLSGTEIYTDKADDSVVHVEIDGKSVGGGNNNLLSKGDFESWTNTTTRWENDRLYISSTGSGGIRFDSDLFELGVKYSLGFKARLVSGEVVGLAGHATDYTAVGYQDGVNLGNWASSVSAPQKPLEVGKVYDYRLEITKDSEGYIYIQPNRSGYGREYELELFDIQLNKGDMPLEYEGLKPTPDHPIEIHSVNDFDVVSQKSEGGVIDGIEIGGRNLLKNSNDFSIFNPYSGASIERQENQPIEEEGISEGTRLIISGGTTSLKTTPSIPVGSDYKGGLTYSFWAKNNGDEPVRFRFNGFVQDDGALSTNEILEPNEARRITVHGHMRNDFDWFQHQIYQTQDGQTIDVTLAQIKLEKGKVATDWTPAPEDITEDSNHPLIDKINLLLSEPLRSAGDIYDRLFRDDSDGLWKVERKVTSFEVDESNVGLQSMGTDFIRFRIGHPIDSTTNRSSNGFFSTHLPYGRNMDGTPEISNGGGNPIIFVWLKKSSLPTPDLEGFRSWISSQRNNGTPFVIQYEIRNYTIETLDQELQDKLNNLRSFQDSNYVYTIINDKTDILSERLKPTLHATFKGGGWYNRWKTEQELERHQGQIDSKADQESLDEVSTELSDFQTVVASREELGEITSALYDYIDDLSRNERNLESAKEDIDRLLTRLPIIENNLGAWVERWSFLDTYVTLGDEGLMISEMNGSTGIRISKDRIDFMDGSGEPVAYITNQVMRINRAIFVDSIQVGEHKVETIAGGHTIWQWMGG